MEDSASPLAINPASSSVTPSPVPLLLPSPTTDAVIPSTFYCPLTLEVMVDPWIDPTDGRTYDKAFLVDWIKNHHNSPATRMPLEVDQLVPNRTLKDVMDEFFELHPQLREGKLHQSQPQQQTAQVIPAASDNSSAEPPSSQASSASSNIIASAAAAGPLESSFILDTEKNVIHVKLLPPPLPASVERVPSDIVCVVDVSGSMGSAVTIQTQDGHCESDGLSRLDLVKHALLTIVESLSENDRLSIVTFETKVSTTFPLTYMNEQSKMIARSKIKNLEPMGGTNLYGGLQEGLMEFSRHYGDVRNQALYLLTDGEPTDHPPLGYTRSLLNFLSSHRVDCSIHTFGFGYDLQSDLLEDIAKIGGGSYAFIPDGGMVGTVFVNAIAQLLCCCASQIQLDLSSIKHQIDQDLLKCYYYLHHTNGKTILNVGSVMLGQERTVILPLEHAPNANFATLHIKYNDVIKHTPTNTTAKLTTDANIHQNDIDQLRWEVVELIRVAMVRQTRGMEVAQSYIQEFMAKHEALIEKVSKGSYLSDLFTDVSGQVTLALSRKDWYYKWGRHYLPSLYRSHLFQLCTNFKDPGLQHYGGELFQSIQSKMNDVFEALPPPTPSVPQWTSQQYGGGGSHGSSRCAASAAPSFIDMHAYNRASNGCFAGGCTITMADASIKRVDQVKRGDQVYTKNGTAVVQYILRTLTKDSKAEMVTFPSGLQITPYHPVRLDNGEWTFPSQHHTTQWESVDSIYTFVLDQHHSVVINDVECITLGHSFKDGVSAHPYFGSDAVVHDVRAIDEAQNRDGLVTIQQNWFVRDEHTNLICGIRERRAE